jgi:hypothetical protein
MVFITLFHPCGLLIWLEIPATGFNIQARKMVPFETTHRISKLVITQNSPKRLLSGLHKHPDNVINTLAPSQNPIPGTLCTLSVPSQTMLY